MRAFGPNVGELRKPVPANLALNAKVPLLGCADDPVQRNSGFEQALNRPRKTGRAFLEQGEGARLETCKKRRHWNKGLRGRCSERRNRKRAVGCKKVGQTICSWKKANLKRKNWRSNSEVIYSTQVFAHGVRKWGKPSVEVEQAILDGGERQIGLLRKHLRVMNTVATVAPRVQSI